MYYHRFIIPLLILITVALFWRASYCKFAWVDDSTYVWRNPYVRQGLTPGNIAWAFTTTNTGYSHPLTWLSLMLDSDLQGTQPRGYHITNILLHALAVILLYLALHVMTAAPMRSALAALLFAVHPLRVESVAWICERKDVLSGCLAFATILAYAVYTHRPNWSRYLLVMVLFALGLLAKPMLVTLPCAFLLLDIWPLRRIAVLNFGEVSQAALPPPSPQTHFFSFLSPGWLVLEKIPLLILAVADSAIAVLFQSKLGAIPGSDRFSLAQRLSNIPISYVRYLGKMVWFRGLIPLYPVEIWPFWEVAGAICFLLLITIAVLVRFRYNPWLAIGWFWFLGMLVPVIGFVPISFLAMADRYTYVPAIGLCIMLVWSLPDRLFTSKTGRLALGTATLVIVATLSAFTWRQIGYYQDTVTLCRHAMEFGPHEDSFVITLAQFLDSEHNAPEALVYYRKAVEIAPESAVDQFNLGSFLNRQGRTREAWVHLHLAAQIQPDSAVSHHIKGIMDMRQSQFDLAAREFQRAIALDRTFIPPYLNLGNILLMQRRFAEALAQYQEALRLNPGDPSTDILVAKALANLGRFDETLPYLHEAIDTEPEVAQTHALLGQILMQLHRFDEAIATLRKAIQLDPGNAQFRAMLQRALSWRQYQGPPIQSTAPHS